MMISVVARMPPKNLSSEVSSTTIVCVNPIPSVVVVTVENMVNFFIQVR